MLKDLLQDGFSWENAAIYREGSWSKVSADRGLQQLDKPAA